MADIFRIGTLSTHWQYTISTVIAFWYGVWSGKSWDKLTVDPYHIHFCTKNTDSYGRNKEGGEKNILIHYPTLAKWCCKSLYWQFDKLQQWINIYLLDLVFIMTIKDFLWHWHSRTDIFRLGSKPNQLIPGSTNKSVFFQTITVVIFAESCTEMTFLLAFIKMPSKIVTGLWEFSLLPQLCILHISSTI